MNEKPDWELVEDNAQPKRRFSQKDFLFSLLGNYPRLKLVGMATVGIVLMTLVALFSLVFVASATVLSAAILLTAWFKAKLFKGKQNFASDIVRK